MALPDPFDFTGKTVVLTGAPGGPGRPSTLAFARSGARLALCARREGPLKVLASDAARWINGHTINVDTGFNAT